LLASFLPKIQHTTLVGYTDTKEFVRGDPPFSWNVVGVHRLVKIGKYTVPIRTVLAPICRLLWKTFLYRNGLTDYTN
jgi:hypothetical protein